MGTYINQKYESIYPSLYTFFFQSFFTIERLLIKKSSKLILNHSFRVMSCGKKVFTLKDLKKYFGGFFNIMMTFVSIWLFVINNQHNIKLSIIHTFRKLYSDVTMYPLCLHQIKLYYVLTWNFGTQYLMYFIRLRFLFKSWLIIAQAV